MKINGIATATEKYEKSAEISIKFTYTNIEEIKALKKAIEYYSFTIPELLLKKCPNIIISSQAEQIGILLTAIYRKLRDTPFEE